MHNHVARLQPIQGIGTVACARSIAGAILQTRKDRHIKQHHSLGHVNTYPMRLPFITQHEREVHCMNTAPLPKHIISLQTAPALHHYMVVSSTSFGGIAIVKGQKTAMALCHQGAGSQFLDCYTVMFMLNTRPHCFGTVFNKRPHW